MAITYVGSGAEAAATGGANLSLPYVADIQAGDLLWVPASSSVTSAYATNAISGFTRAYALDSGGGSPVGAGFYKIATGSETGSVTVVTPGGNSLARMFAFRGVDPTTPLDAAPVGFGSSTGVTAYVVPDQTTTTAGAALLLHTWSNTATGTWTQPTFYTEVMDSTAGGTVGAASAAYRIWSGSGSTGTRTVTRSASVRGGAAGVVLRPAADATTGSSSVVLPALVSVATAALIVTGTTDAAIPMPQSAGAASVSNPGTSAVALPSLTSSATGTTALTVASQAVLPRPTSAAAATVRVDGQSAVVLPPLAASATATTSSPGSSVVVLPPLAASGAADVYVVGTSEVMLPQLVCAAEAEASKVEGSSAALLPMLEVAGEALVFLDTSNWRDITITVGTPAGHPFSAGNPVGHPLQTGAPRSDT